MTVASATRLASAEVAGLDPYQFMAVIGKRVIHPGGRRSSEALIQMAMFEPNHRVLDVGCGVATTAIEIARRYGSQVTAVDISPLMLQRAQHNVQAAGLAQKIEVKHGNILELAYADSSFDNVIAEAVTMFVDRPPAAAELLRVCVPGGRVLATEFFWRKPPTPEAREIFVAQVCPGMQIDTLDDWVALYRAAGLSDVRVESGPFDMMTPRGLLADEGFAHSIALMGRCMARLSYLRKMAWLMPRMQRAVPYLGFILLCGTKPSSRSN
ncbi:MAG TPA: methyltransferase domain-containing protein [Chloroflexota bacterium]